MPRLLRPILLGLALFAQGEAFAQQGAPDRTGTGGGPDSTITAPNTNALGVTKPPGAEEGPATPAERRELRRIERQDDRIDDSICEGCGR